ncbi:hypothetical protein KJE20_12033 [Pyrenophora tritici-repentis]|nr:hypothetical protein KJE20_12033 [Pyrenophora tritici-repentis]
MIPGCADLEILFITLHVNVVLKTLDEEEDVRTTTSLPNYQSFYPFWASAISGPESGM